MAAITTVLAIASLAVAAGAAVASNQQAVEQRQDQKNAQSVAAAQRQAQMQQGIRDQVRQDRVKRAQIIAASGDTGTLGSSGELGAVGSLASSTAQNIGTITRTSLSTDAYYGYMQQASDAAGRAQLYSGVSSLAGSAAGKFAGTYSAQKDWDSWFGAPRTNINAPPQG